MHVNDVDLGRLRRLARARPDGAKVVSLYVDLDPSDFAIGQARATEITSLLDEAGRRSREAPVDHEAAAALREDVARLRDFLRRDAPAKGARALAVFCSGPRGLFEVLRLPESVPRAVVVDDTPWLDPLIGRQRTRRGVALVSRRTLRVFADDEADGRLAEVHSFTDQVHGQHDQGGWSQANYERSIEQDVDAHLRRAAEALFELHRKRDFDAIAIGATAELCPRLYAALHAYVRERVIGRFDVDVERGGADEVLQASKPLFAALENRRLDELLERLRPALATGTGGLADTLAALNERRVEALLYEPGFSAPGVACQQCDWLGAEGGRCPACGADTSARENVLDDMISAALLQSAQVRSIGERPDLGPVGGVAALVRF